jgi:hypothetical protein
MRITLRELEAPTRPPIPRLDVRIASGDCLRPDSLTLNESSRLSLAIYPDTSGPFEARVCIGNVPVASTRVQDRPDFLLELPDFVDSGADLCYSCRGQLLRDWVGQTELSVEVWHDGGWRRVLHVNPLYVTAGKLEQEAFEVLCREIAAYSAAALLDVYGKTSIGLSVGRQRTETGPVAELQRVRQAVNHLAIALREIARQPAYRLKARRVREPALSEQSVSVLTLEEACVDPTLALAHRQRVYFREHVREVAAPSYNLPENRTISGFLNFLARELRGLRGRLQREVNLRVERRSYRHRRPRGADASPLAEKTWWEQEDLPRIEELKRLLESLTALEGELAGLRRYPFLARDAELREMPQSTPLFRTRKAYAGAFKVIVNHFQAYRFSLDGGHLLMRAKSLPVLYEWWCVLEVLRCLQGALQLRTQPFGQGSPFQRLEEERDRFVVEFTPNQHIDFADDAGHMVRLRYVPSYRSASESRGRTFGLLGPEPELTPDIALEIYPDATSPTPELVIVFDAKYSSQPQQKKLDEVRSKYGKIGIFRTGRVLSRQVWALTPAAPLRYAPGPTEVAPFCTVDNHSVWLDEFDMSSTAAGAIQTKPLLTEGRSPLDCLVRLLLSRSGVQVRA